MFQSFASSCLTIKARSAFSLNSWKELLSLIILSIEEVLPENRISISFREISLLSIIIIILSIIFFNSRTFPLHGIDCKNLIELSSNFTGGFLCLFVISLTKLSIKIGISSSRSFRGGILIGITFNL